MNFKRFLAVILCLLITILSVCGCSKKDKKDEAVFTVYTNGVCV